MNWLTKLFTPKYRIYCNRWVVAEIEGELLLLKDEYFPTQYADNNAGRLQDKSYRLFVKYSNKYDGYCYQFFIGTNSSEMEKDVRKV